MSIKFFENVDNNDIVGGKGYNLSRLYKNGFNVPNGFIITGDVFNDYFVSTVNDMKNYFSDFEVFKENIKNIENVWY